ncbi:hypothetical protein [Streptomyces sp. NPDC014995]|uniref:hypothetical protein n=1 Tax=Streptomyces sp. NPDC014995 TaxID=3364936 RepID=UPI0036FDE212
MHRTTTTTATLLLTVAVSALAGCVTIQYPSAPGKPAAGRTATPPRPSLPRPERETDRETGRQVVQSPALEALEMVGKDRGPVSSAPPPTPTAPAEQPPPSRSQAKKPHPRPRSAHPEPRRPAQPHVQVPDVRDDGRKEARGNTDVCALGRQHGGWRTDSPEAVICEQTYGR